MTKSKKILVGIIAAVTGLAAGYTAVWNGLYHFKWKQHITEHLTYEELHCEGTPYRMYETLDGTDNYTLNVPRFPHMNLYGGFASAQDVGGEKPFNPNGLDLDILANVYFNPLCDNVKYYVFFVTPYESTDQYEEGQNFAYVLDPDGNLTNTDELSESAMALYDHAKDAISDIMDHEKEYFNIKA